jgi:hypothetical protein
MFMTQLGHEHAVAIAGLVRNFSDRSQRTRRSTPRGIDQGQVVAQLRSLTGPRSLGGSPDPCEGRVSQRASWLSECTTPSHCRTCHFQTYVILDLPRSIDYTQHVAENGLLLDQGGACENDGQEWQSDPKPGQGWLPLPRCRGPLAGRGAYFPLDGRDRGLHFLTHFAPRPAAAAVTDRVSRGRTRP